MTEVETLKAKIAELELTISGKTFFDVHEELAGVTASLNAAHSQIELLDAQVSSLRATIRGIAQK